MVNDFEFNYSRDIDFAYENIKDPKFRRKVKNLNIKFPNNLLAGMFGIEQAIYFEADASSAEVPDVSFE